MSILLVCGNGRSPLTGILRKHKIEKLRECVGISAISKMCSIERTSATEHSISHYPGEPVPSLNIKWRAARQILGRINQPWRICRDNISKWHTGLWSLKLPPFVDPPHSKPIPTDGILCLVNDSACHSLTTHGTAWTCLWSYYHESADDVACIQDKRSSPPLPMLLSISSRTVLLK